MMSVEDQVLKETLEFERCLGELLQSIPRKWVVFKDGQVRSIHDTFEGAYRAGVETYGVTGGQAIVQVAPRKPLPISASVAFGLG